ncbi:MAG: c-type cytochrome [Gemmatimonadota bacterium]
MLTTCLARATNHLATAVLLGALVFSVASPIAGQDSTRSTTTGVYTADQAEKGREVYGAMCVSCHTVASHTGGSFKESWIGKLLYELFSFIQETMPDGAGGTLTSEETTLVVAYLLQLNGFPAGSDPLPSDSGLKAIRFDTVTTLQGPWLRPR